MLRLLRPSPNPALQRSLYARSALFVLTGSGAFLGALILLSSLIVNDAEERLLDERIGMVRVASAFLEGRLRDDLIHLATAGAGAAVMDDPAQATAAMGQAAGETFALGAAVLDTNGDAIASTPGGFPLPTTGPTLKALLAQVRSTHAPAISPLVEVAGRSALVLATELPGTARVGGLVVGVLPTESHDLLAPLRKNVPPHQTELTLVDATGIVVASTDRGRLFDRADHKGVLRRAIEQHGEVQGRCHGCHAAPDGGAPERETAVLAFAPLPTLALGLGAVEPESVALAPALSLRRRLWVMGIALIGLFVVFTGLAVQSVVRPIRRLTRAVARAEQDRKPVPTGTFGPDEIGELAFALDRWRGRTQASLQAAEASGAALRAEGLAIRRHLDALQDISALSLTNPELNILLERSLGRMLAAVGLEAGALRVTRAGHETLSCRAWAADAAAGHLAQAQHLAATHPADARESGASLRPFGSSPRLLGAAVSPIDDLHIAVAVQDVEPGDAETPLWLGSLFRQICLCTSHVLVRDAEHARQRTQQSVLKRVLKAQEDERQRVARDLHDTVAQDLAALRLELERLAGHEPNAAARERLELLEGRAREMLQTVRTILLDLRLSVLESLGLVPAMRWLLERTTREQGVKTHFMIDGDEALPVPYETAVMFFRILQEALLNAVQHANPDHIFVTLRLGERAEGRQPGGVTIATTIELCVEDDGGGFDPAILIHPQGGIPGASNHGLGLDGVQERARILGGELFVTSAPGEGATLRVVAPLHPPPMAPEPTT